MKTIKGFVLDTSLKKIANNLIDMENSGVVIDINNTIKNWNEKHELVPPEMLSNLQNDVSLFVELEKKRQLKSMSAIGYGSYIAEPFVKKAKELMALPSEQEPQKQNS